MHKKDQELHDHKVFFFINLLKMRGYTVNHNASNQANGFRASYEPLEADSCLCLLPEAPLDCKLHEGINLSESNLLVFQNTLFSLLTNFLSSLFQAAHGGGKGLISSLLSSSCLHSFMNIFAYVAFYLEVSLTLQFSPLIRFYPLFLRLIPARLRNLEVLAFPLCYSLPPPRSLVSPSHWWPVSKLLNLVFSKLDLHSSDSLGIPRATPLLSSCSSFPTSPIAS
jgi:hypothetical protein